MPNLKDSCEQTLAIIKPEAFRRGVVAKIVMMIVRHNLEIVAFGKVTPSQELARAHYREHEGRDYFPHLVAQFTGQDVYVLVLKGPNAIQALRELIGPFREGERKRGTIRYRFMRAGGPAHENFIHGSDSPENAAREIKLWESKLVR